MSDAPTHTIRFTLNPGTIPIMLAFTICAGAAFRVGWAAIGWALGLAP